MKKISLPALGAFMSVASIFSMSCNKVEDAVAKKQDPISFTQNIILTIPKSTNTAQQVAYGEARFDLDSAIQKQSGVSTLTYSKYAKHVMLTSLVGSVVNGDDSNNFNNITFSPSAFPAVLFNTTNDVNTATVIGGNTQITPLTDPYNWNIPISGNTDLLPHINGKTWDYFLSYKLQKATTKDVQVNLTANYEVQFQ